MLTRADIRFDGDRPWDVQVRNDSLFDRVLAYGNLGAGEAYSRISARAECSRGRGVHGRLVGLRVA